MLNNYDNNNYVIRKDQRLCVFVLEFKRKKLINKTLIYVSAYNRRPHGIHICNIRVQQPQCYNLTHIRVLYSNTRNYNAVKVTQTFR